MSSTIIFSKTFGSLAFSINAKISNKSELLGILTPLDNT